MADGLTNAIQESLLALLAFDVDGYRELAGLVQTEHFDGFYREIAGRVLDYGAKYGKPPGDHFPDILDDLLEKGDRAKARTYLNLVRSLMGLRQNLNRVYVVSRVKDWIRHQTIKSAILDAADEYKSENDETVPKVEAILSKALKAQVETFSPGVRLSDKDALRFLNKDRYPVFRTGIDQLDKAFIGPSPSRLMLFIAPTGYGKSWWLVNLGKYALMQQRKVLHISLEMSEDEVLQRYFQSWFSLSKYQDPDLRLPFFEMDKLGRLSGIKFDKLGAKHLSLQDPKIDEHLAAMQRDWGLRLSGLIVKGFPMRSLSIRGYENYLDQLENREEFIPDLVIIDSPYLMKVDQKDYRIALGRTTEELRGIATKRNHALAGGAQSNRAGATASNVRGTHVGEDWSQIQTADMAITYSRTKAEEELGLARLFVEKARSDADKFTVLITQSYALGQFCLSSVRMNKNYDRLLKELVGDRADEKQAEDD